MHKNKPMGQDALGTLSIGRLIMKMSLPIMLSMLIQSLYNVVDSIFVSWISEEAITAVSLAFPLQGLLIAFSVGTGVGTQSLLSRKLGERNEKVSIEVREHGIFLSLVTWGVFALSAIFFSRPFMKLFTEDESLLGLSLIYIRIVLVLSIGMFLSVMLERIMQAYGDSFHSMITQATGAIVNIILDPVFIFGFRLGVAGAAIATVIGQWVSCFLGFHFLRKYSGITVSLKGFRPNGKIVKGIYAVGVPQICTTSLMAVMVSAINTILISFSATAVAVFGIYGKLQSFVFMPVLGLSAGTVPIIGYNYGARNRHRITETVKKVILIAFAFMSLGFLVFQIFPDMLLSVFNATPEMMKIGIPALKTISWSFLLASISIAMSSSFQGTGVGFYTLIQGFIRQIVVLLPVAYLFSRFWGVYGIWLSFLVAEVVGLAVSLILYARIYRKKIKPLEA